MINIKERDIEVKTDTRDQTDEERLFLKKKKNKIDATMGQLTKNKESMEGHKLIKSEKMEKEMLECIPNK